MKETGTINCARCESDVVIGSKVLKFFCINQECYESEASWLAEIESQL